MTRPPRSITVPDAPGLAHKAPIPAAARVGPLLCSSAIAGKDSATGELPTDPAGQARHAFANMRRLLEAGGASLADVARLTVYVTDDGMRDAVNEQWHAAFPDPADRPARHILVHELQHGMRLQIEFIACVASGAALAPPAGTDPKTA